MKTLCLVTMSFVTSLALAQAPSQQRESSYKGTLVDASCGTSGPGAASAATPSKPRSEANRTAAPENAGKTCSVSAATTRFALKLDDGRTIRFDSVGDLRAQEALKNRKKWTEAAGSGKPIRAKVSGFMTDNKLMVISIS